MKKLAHFLIFSLSIACAWAGGPENTVVPISNGGTGQTAAAAGLSALGGANASLSNLATSTLPFVLARRSGANQSTTTAVPVEVDWNSKFYDSATALQGATFTAPVGGIYTVSPTVCWGVSATGIRLMEVLINGVSANPRLLSMTGGVANYHTQSFTKDIHLNAGDKVSITAYQESGGNLDIIADLTVLSVSLGWKD